MVRRAQLYEPSTPAAMVLALTRIEQGQIFKSLPLEWNLTVVQYFKAA